MTSGKMDSISANCLNCRQLMRNDSSQRVVGTNFSGLLKAVAGRFESVGFLILLCHKRVAVTSRAAGATR
jgi:hypothetical protein